MKIKKVLKAILFYLFNSFISYVPVYSLRHWYLKNILRFKIGHETSIHMGCFFTGTNIQIGNNTVLNRNCYIDGRAGIKIGNNVSISPETYILSLDHDPQSPTFETIQKNTVINDNVWIGVRSIILPGVVIGEGAVIGAGSVVTRDINSFEIAAGNPARKIKMRSEKILYKIKYFPMFNTDELLD